MCRCDGYVICVGPETRAGALGGGMSAVYMLNCVDG